eukprot:scaffold30512_cov107-Isochrysis_galbana.AAC.2
MQLCKCMCGAGEMSRLPTTCSLHTPLAQSMKTFAVLRQDQASRPTMRLAEPAPRRGQVYRFVQMPVFIVQAQHIVWISQLHYALIESPRIRRTLGAHHDSWRSSESRESHTRGHREAQPGHRPHAEAMADRCSSAAPPSRSPSARPVPMCRSLVGKVFRCRLPYGMTEAYKFSNAKKARASESNLEFYSQRSRLSRFSFHNVPITAHARSPSLAQRAAVRSCRPLGRIAH